MLSTLWLLARRVLHEYGDDNCSHMAAAISYYVLFSIIPLTIFTVSIFGMVVRDDDLQQDVADDIVEFLNVEAGAPAIEADAGAVEEQYGAEALAEIEEALAALTDAESEAFAEELDAGNSVDIAGRSLDAGLLDVHSDNTITDTLEGVSDVSAPLTLVGLAGMGWAASAMFGAVRKSLNIAWDADVHRPIVQQKLVDLFMVLSLGLLLGASVGSTGALRALRELSDSGLGPLSEGTGFFWAVLPFFLPAVFSFGVFLLLYRYVPNTTTPFRDVWPGAVFATVLFELMKNGFALYIANFDSYSGAYGALGGILLFLLWTYLTSNILLIGAEVAAEYPRVMRGDYDEMYAGGPGLPLVTRARKMLRDLVLAARLDDDDG